MILCDLPNFFKITYKIHPIPSLVVFSKNFLFVHNLIKQNWNQIIQLSATNSVPQNGLNGGPNAERGETKTDRRIDVAFIFKCSVNSSRVGISKSEFRIKMAAA